MIAGHITVTYSVYRAAANRIPALPALPLLVGALLPDLIDKPLFLFWGLPPRGVGHAVAVLAALIYLLHKALPRFRPVVAALAVGAAAHLAQDWPHFEIIMWPFLGPWPHFPKMEMGETAWAYYFGFAHPYMLAVEMASWPFCVYFLFRQKMPSAMALNEQAAGER